MDNLFNEPIWVGVAKQKYEQKLKQFAENVSYTTNYIDCGQTNHKIKVYQHFVGKLIEIAAYACFRKNNLAPNIFPDFNIYKGENKNWDADLYIGTNKVSVKGQDVTSARQFGLSWTFQDIKKGRSDRALYNTEEVIVPGLYCNNIDDKQTLHTIIFPPIKMKNAKFDNPVKHFLYGKKKVLYAKDNYPTLNEWLNVHNIDLRKREKVYGKDSKTGKMKCFERVVT